VVTLHGGDATTSPKLEIRGAPGSGSAVIKVAAGAGTFGQDCEIKWTRGCDPATGACEAVTTDFVQPNGLAFSPDERLLYIADTGVSHVAGGPRHIRRFAVASDGRTLSGGEVFATCTAGLFDGFRFDVHGNLWTSAGDGVHCYAPDGTLLGKIAVPEVVANVCFGGPKRNRLFICGTTSLYAIYLAVRGATRPAP